MKRVLLVMLICICLVANITVSQGANLPPLPALDFTIEELRDQLVEISDRVFSLGEIDSSKTSHHWFGVRSYYAKGYETWKNDFARWNHDYFGVPKEELQFTAVVDNKYDEHKEWAISLQKQEDLLLNTDYQLFVNMSRYMLKALVPELTDTDADAAIFEAIRLDVRNDFKSSKGFSNNIYDYTLTAPNGEAFIQVGKYEITFEIYAANVVALTLRMNPNP